MIAYAVYPETHVCLSKVDIFLIALVCVDHIQHLDT